MKKRGVIISPSSCNCIQHERSYQREGLNVTVKELEKIVPKLQRPKKKKLKYILSLGKDKEMRSLFNIVKFPKYLRKNINVC